VTSKDRVRQNYRLEDGYENDEDSENTEERRGDLYLYHTKRNVTYFFLCRPSGECGRKSSSLGS
jgi:hypothetical protein